MPIFAGSARAGKKAGLRRPPEPRSLVVQQQGYAHHYRQDDA
jgi:hypothetical protein